MIFALIDYFHFRRKSGRYSRGNPNNLMAAAWDSKLPDHVTRMLEDGDLLVYQNFGSAGSWLIMYGSSSHVSHVGLYCDGGKIAHMNPPRLVIEPLANTFHENIRILPVKMPSPVKPNSGCENFVSPKVGEPYGYKSVIGKAINIASARYWPVFRWKFFADVFIALAILDAFSILLFEVSGFSWVAAFYFLTILLNGLRWQFDPLDLSDGNHGYPGMALHFASACGGLAIGDAFAVKDYLPEGAGPIFRPLEPE